MGIWGCSKNIANLREREREKKEFVGCSGIAHRLERRIPERGQRIVRNLDSSRALVGSLFSEAMVRVSKCPSFGSIDTRLKFQGGQSLSGRPH